jgi:hypothetical protein
VVVIDGEQRRTPTARNCNDVRPRKLLGAIDLLDATYAGPDMVTDCSSVYTAAPDATRPNDDDTSMVGWTFMKRVALTGPEAVASLLIQVVVLDDLIEEDDKRVDVAEGEERRNLVFEYNIAEDTIYGVETTSRNGNGRPGDHWVRSKGEAGTIAAALTVRVERTPFSEAEVSSHAICRCFGFVDVL